MATALDPLKEDCDFCQNAEKINSQNVRPEASRFCSNTDFFLTHFDKNRRFAKSSALRADWFREIPCNFPARRVGLHDLLRSSLPAKPRRGRAALCGSRARNGPVPLRLPLSYAILTTREQGKEQRQKGCAETGELYELEHCLGRNSELCRAVFCNGHFAVDPAPGVWGAQLSA